MKFRKQVGYEPAKSWLNFGSDPELIWDMFYYIWVQSSSHIQQMWKVKLKLGKPVTMQCRENFDWCTVCVLGNDIVLITFCVSRRQREMYSGHGCLCVRLCLSLLVVHYWTDLQLVHWFCCCDNMSRMLKVSKCLYWLCAWFQCSVVEV